MVILDDVVFLGSYVLTKNNIVGRILMKDGVCIDEIIHQIIDQAQTTITAVSSKQGDQRRPRSVKDQLNHITAQWLDKAEKRDGDRKSKAMKLARKRAARKARKEKYRT